MHCKGGVVKNMKQRELLEFRTPQHPSLGTNNWGGASPLLARSIPKESLEQKYTRLNTVRTRDEIFPAEDDYYLASKSKHESSAKHESTRDEIFPAEDDYYLASKSKHESSAKKCNRVRGILKKLLFLRKEKTAVLGRNAKKRKWLPRLDPQNRWPQGWC